MENRAFHKLLSQIDKLTPSQTKHLENQLHKKCSIKTLEDVTGEADHCPHCGATELYKWGVKSGLQRYKCKACNKTFNILTKTPLARLRRKEVWADYIQNLIAGSTVKHSAEHCKVADSTAFRWRHRMLQAARQIKAKELHGIVELDEIHFLRSEKGNHHLERKPHKRGGWAKKGLSLKQFAPVLIARDRNGNMTDSVLPNSYDGTIAEVLLPLLDSNDVLLCSDSKSSYKSFANMFDFAHETINARKEHVAKGIYHVQNVNAYGSRLRRWMVRFHGVSTKHLPSYLGWMRILDTQKELSADDFLRIIAGYRKPIRKFPHLTRI
jgi:transposase-like protein